MKNFSQACENNKRPIGAQLQHHFSNVSSVLEIGSGTGQHALFFSLNLPRLIWQASDHPANLPMLTANLMAYGPPQLPSAIALDVTAQPWKVAKYDAVFSANTLHIMDWSVVEDFFRGLAPVLNSGGLLCVYGPFKYAGNYTSASNADFDNWLKLRDGRSGIRDFEAVNKLAAAQGLTLINDTPMPANNRLLLWKCSSPTQAEN
ncbi:MAG: DUF938 domain-containing protein [Cyanobacteria bacterium P01_H01_bin.15]